MERLAEVLSYPLLSFAGQTISVGRIVMVLVVVIGGYLVSRWIERILNRRLAGRQINPDVVHLIRRVYLITVIAVIGVTILDLLNVPLTAFAFISGAVAIGVGFGAQNIINNFISGWILMWERPIRIGDFLEVGDARGTVESINTRSTLIRRVDGVHLLIPNSHLLENMVVNWTLVDQLARAQVRVGVAYGSPVRKVAELLERAATERSDVIANPAPLVIFEDFGDSALIFDLYFWIETDTEIDLRIIRSEIRFQIDAWFAENGIVIAFPQRDVHVGGIGPVEVRLKRDE